MSDHSKSEPNGREEEDPLSATAMFFRTLDKRDEAMQAEASPKPDTKIPEEAPGRGEDWHAGSARGAGKGEFTAIFGKVSSGQSYPISPNPVRQAAESQPPNQPISSESNSGGRQDPGEFTRIFVKGTGAKPAARSSEGAPETAPPAPGKGFSAPGVSDAASAEIGSSQVFKPISKVSSAGSRLAPTDASPAFGAEDRKSGGPLNPVRNEALPSRENEPISSGQEPHSVTELIQSLSSRPGSGGRSRTADEAPYRPEPAVSLEPAVKPSAHSEFDSGGVTQFIQRLSEAAPPSPPPVEVRPTFTTREANSDPGEYTRIISSLNRTAASTPDTPASTPASATSAPAFVRPVAPAMPAVPAVPAIPAAPQMTPHAFSRSIVPPATPAQHLPPLPSIAVPKGKLEALVPMLLVVNTFLLLMILVVMIFLIRSK